MTVIPFDYYPKLMCMTRTERAAKYYDEQLSKPYPKYIEHPSFHLLGVLLDRMELNDVEVTSETLADLKDDGKVNGSTSLNPAVNGSTDPYKSTTNDPPKLIFDDDLPLAFDDPFEGV